MTYSPKQAQSLAGKVRKQFGSEIAAASSVSGIPADFLAGFVGVECGKNKAGDFVPGATRFEPHVYRNLIALRDGIKARYQGLTRRHVAGKTDLEIRALSKSYGPTQIMGWHTLKNLPGFTIEDLNRPGRRFLAATELLKINSAADLKAKAWPRVLRTWNTGKPDGKTYHADYVPNALAVMAAYAALAPAPIVITAAGPIDPVTTEPILEAEPVVEATPAPEPAVEVKPDPASSPEPGLVDSLEQYGQKFEKVDNVAARVSGASWMMTLLAKIGGAALVVWEVIRDNKETIVLVAGVALIIVGLWYFSRAKDRANARALKP